MECNGHAVIYGSGAQHLYNDLAHKVVLVDNGKFSNGETRIKVNGSVRGQHISIVQSFNENTNDQIIELILMIDALKRAGAFRVAVIVPIFPYARQERKDDAGTPISARVICDMLAACDIDRLIAVDLHATAIQGFMPSSIVFDHVSSSAFLAYHLSQLLPNHEEWMICSPDGGGVKRAQKLASLLDIRDLCVMDKTRSNPNEVGNIKVILGKVKGRKVLIVDDMTDTGGTLNKAMEALYNSGASEVRAVCTHGIFSGKAFEILDGKKILSTNTIDWENRSGVPESFKCLDVKPFIDDIINRVHNKGTIGSFFHKWP